MEIFYTPVSHRCPHILRYYTMSRPIGHIECPMPHVSERYDVYTTREASMARLHAVPHHTRRRIRNMLSASCKYGSQDGRHSVSGQLHVKCCLVATNDPVNLHQMLLNWHKCCRLHTPVRAPSTKDAYHGHLVLLQQATNFDNPSPAGSPLGIPRPEHVLRCLGHMPQAGSLVPMAKKMLSSTYSLF